MKQGILYLIAFAGLGMLFVAAAGIPTGKKPGLKDSDFVTYIRDGDVDDWGELVPLIPDLFAAGAARATVEEQISELGFEVATDPDVAQTLTAAEVEDREVYSGDSTSIGCNVLIALALGFEDDRLVAADGFSLDRGCS